MTKKISNIKNQQSDALTSDLTLIEVKKLTALLASYNENNAKRDAQLAKYEAEPIKVIPIKDIAKSVKIDATVNTPKELDDAIVTICSHIGDIHDQQEECADDLDEITKELQQTNAKIQNITESIYDLAHPKEPEPQNWVEGLRLWWNKDSTRRGRLSFCGRLLVAMILVNALFFVYQYRWSDYAWSKRAYNVMKEEYPNNPEKAAKVFHWMLQRFEEEKRGAIIDEILERERRLEEKRLREEQDKAAQGEERQSKGGSPQSKVSAKHQTMRKTEKGNQNSKGSGYVRKD